ncbi:hypothetical protein Tco_1450931, partial [Tanacetum coccineum]
GGDVVILVSVWCGGDSGDNEGVATSGCWHGEDDEDDEDRGGVVG